jgi:hypothetical protein
MMWACCLKNRPRTAARRSDADTDIVHTVMQENAHDDA